MKLGFYKVHSKWWKVGVLLLYGLSLIAAVVPIRSLLIDNSLEIWFYKDDPRRPAYDRGHSLFGNWDWMSIYVQPTSGVYDPKFLKSVREITTGLEAIPDIRKVISITNARGNLLAENELSYQPILGLPPWSLERLEQFKATLETNLVYRKTLIQPGGGDDFSILLQIDNREIAKDAYRINLVNNIQALLDKFSPEVKYYALAGTPYMNSELNRSSRHDMHVFIPLVTLLVAVIGWLVFRNFRDVAITLLTLSGVVMWSVALMMLNYELNMVTIMMPTILVTVSVASVMHMIVTFHLLRRENPEWNAEKAIKTAMRNLWVPSLGATATTAFGFLSLVAADILPITLLGYFSALGILFSYCLTFTILPLLLLLCWSDSEKAVNLPAAGKSRALFHRVSLFSIISKTSLVHPIFTLGLFVVIGGGISAGILKLDADTDYAKMFTGKSEVQKHYSNVQRAGYATNSLTMLIHAPDGLEDIPTFRSVMTLEQEIAKLPMTRTIIGPVKILAEVDRALALDKTAWLGNFDGYDRGTIAQLILTSEISGNDDLRDALTTDHRDIQLTVFTDNFSSSEIRAYAATLDRLAHDVLPIGTKAEVTGTPLLWANMDYHLLASQSNILLSVLLPLALIMMFIVRSPPLVILGLIVNLLPVTIILGLMGWLGLKINISTIIIGGITMGIAVDDTIHFLWHYRAEIRNGKPFYEALAHTYHHTGTAIFMTAILLGLGFLVMAASEFVPTADFGRLTSLTIVIAFATEIFLMPALLYLHEVGKKRIGLQSVMPNTTANLTILLTMSFALLNAPTVQAAEDEDKGLAIAQEADRRNQGYGDMLVHQTMTLIDQDGRMNQRELDIKVLEVPLPGEGDKLLITFSQPRDVQGTTLLTHTHVKEPDEQWLYLPALKRTKRISSSNKSGAFMGSEFSYEDMVPKDIEKYRYKFIREESCYSMVCSIVESVPAYRDSGYEKILVWLDNTEYRLQRAEFYDHRGRLLKTLTFNGYQQYLGKYWRPDELYMANHQNQKSTKMTFNGYQFRNGYRQQDFQQTNLQRE